MEKIINILKEVPRSEKIDFIRNLRTYLSELEGSMKNNFSFSTEIRKYEEEKKSKSDIEQLFKIYVINNIYSQEVIIDENETFKKIMGKNMLHYLVDNNFHRVLSIGFMEKYRPFRNLLLSDKELNYNILHKSIAVGDDIECFTVLCEQFIAGKLNGFYDNDVMDYFLNSKTASGHTCFDVAIGRKKVECFAYFDRILVNFGNVIARTNLNIFDRTIMLFFDDYIDTYREFLMKTKTGYRYLHELNVLSYRSTFVHHGFELIYSALNGRKEFKPESIVSFLKLSEELETFMQINFMRDGVEKLGNGILNKTIKEFVVDISNIDLSKYPKIQNHIQNLMNRIKPTTKYADEEFIGPSVQERLPLSVKKEKQVDFPSQAFFEKNISEQSRLLMDKIVKYIGKVLPDDEDVIQDLVNGYMYYADIYARDNKKYGNSNRFISDGKDSYKVLYDFYQMNGTFLGIFNNSLQKTEYVKYFMMSFNSVVTQIFKSMEEGENQPNGIKLETNIDSFLHYSFTHLLYCGMPYLDEKEKIDDFVTIVCEKLISLATDERIKKGIRKYLNDRF